MKVQIQGKPGEISLTQKDFLAAGGQGAVYAKGATAYKVYTDISGMLPVGKIQELAVLTHPNVIRPQDILTDSKGKICGYTMKYIPDSYALCQLFTKAYRDRNNISPDMMLKLVKDLQSMVSYVHQHNILIVDLNEMNFLSSKDYKNLYAIDTDSWQTKSYPATAICDSIRDRHNKVFSQGTDWFSFAVVSFQMFIGLNPYRGKHPSLKTVEDRMLNNVSALNKDVSVPSAAFPFTVIPQSYLEWYRAVLDDGKRVPPPTDLITQIKLVATIQQVISGNIFEIQELGDWSDPIHWVTSQNNNPVILTSKELRMGKDTYPLTYPDGIHLSIAPKTQQVVMAAMRHSKLVLFSGTTRKKLDCDFTAEEMMTYQDRIYLKSGGQIMELQWLESGELTPTFVPVANAMERATQIFSGVAIQNMLGAKYVSVFPETSCHEQIRIPELDDYRIVDAKFDSGVLMVIGAKKAKYSKLIIKIKDGSYSLREILDPISLDLNFIVLDNGVCIDLIDDGKLEVFSSRLGHDSSKLMEDPAIKGNYRLVRYRGKAAFYSGSKLFSFTMKVK